MMRLITGLLVVVAVVANSDDCGKHWGAATRNFILRTKDIVYALPLNPVKNSDKVAVLVEPRNHSCIEYVVRNVMHYLPGWSLQIYHGPDNLDYIKEVLTHDISERAKDELLSKIHFNDMQQVVEHTNRVQRKVWPKWLAERWDQWYADDAKKQRETGNFNMGRNLYANAVIDPLFWKQVQGENVLLFQTDSWLCRPGLEDHLEYDYVGAMWRMCSYGEDHIFWPHCKGGNGGLSIRKRSLMRKWIRTLRRSTQMEDYQIALWMKDQKAHTPSLELKQDLFCEELQPRSSNTVALGIHKIWHYQSEHAVQSILNRCMQDLVSGHTEL